MAKAIKNVEITWTWDGDKESLLGFNVALCEDGKTPTGETVVQAWVPKSNTYSYTFKNLTVDVGVAYKSYIQACYETRDSDWLSNTGGVVTDDGNTTISSKNQTDAAATTATWDGITGVNKPADNATASYAGTAPPAGSNFKVGTAYYSTNSSDYGSVYHWNGTIWALSADRTTTAIANGFITTGVLEVGSGEYGSGNAGISGNVTVTPDTDVRFWAGDTFANRDLAHFKVQNNGEVFSRKITIGDSSSGQVIADGDTLKIMSKEPSGISSVLESGSLSFFTATGVRSEYANRIVTGYADSGTPIVLDPPFRAIPKITLMPKDILAYSATLGSSLDQRLQLEATNVSVDGFTVNANLFRHADVSNLSFSSSANMNPYSVMPTTSPARFTNAETKTWIIGPGVTQMDNATITLGGDITALLGDPTWAGWTDGFAYWYSIWYTIPIRSYYTRFNIYKMENATMPSSGNVNWSFVGTTAYWGGRGGDPNMQGLSEGQVPAFSHPSDISYSLTLPSAGIWWYKIVAVNTAVADTTFTAMFRHYGNFFDWQRPALNWGTDWNLSNTATVAYVRPKSIAYYPDFMKDTSAKSIYYLAIDGG